MAKERELKWVKDAQEEAEEKASEETKESAEEAEAVSEEAAQEKETEEAAGEEAQEDAAEKPEEEPEETESAKVQEAQERYQRLFAEFDNFRKRTEKEKAARYDMGARDVVEKILPVLDSFELALKNVPEAEKDSPFVDGMEKVQKQFLQILKDLGVEPIEAVGQEFDPAFHNAVMHVEDEEAGENIIVEEFQKGYKYKDHIVRYSMVKVAN